MRRFRCIFENNAVPSRTPHEKSIRRTVPVIPRKFGVEVRICHREQAITQILPAVPTAG